ncbi:histidinol-phosphate transaminase [Candidatus Halobeggiatoa sp. HSG11]|nr:histidinol-phosphate transaminase [Candidatus Halobeggiatoa sp. HSG11]
MNNWIRPEIQQLTAYHVPKSGNAIKLDAMENPYSWSVAYKEAWLEILRNASLNRYPESSADEIKQQLRSVMKIPDDMSIILGNGSDELIQMLALALNDEGRVLLAPEPSFVMYRMIANFVRMQYIGVPLQVGDFELDMFAMLEDIEIHQPALIFLAYPNNPTGNAFSTDDIEAILETANGLVVIDEAYAPFAEHTFIHYLHEYPNLLVMRTLSKLGLAGLRLGFLVGSSEWLGEIEKLRLPYNINTLTQLSTVFALQNYDVLEQQTKQIKQDRERLAIQLEAMDGIHVWPSQANFLLFQTKNAKKVFDRLKARNVLIKCLHGSHPTLENCLRVTVGTPEENNIFLQVLEQVIET